MMVLMAERKLSDSGRCTYNLYVVMPAKVPSVWTACVSMERQGVLSPEAVPLGSKLQAAGSAHCPQLSKVVAKQIVARRKRIVKVGLVKIVIRLLLNGFSCIKN